MSKFCQVCGFLLKGDENVCPECGAEIQYTENIEESDNTVHFEQTHNPVEFGTEVSGQEEEYKKPFPWLILVSGLLLVLIVGGYILYSQFYKPYAIDRDAPRYYTYANSTFLRSSQVTGVEYNVLNRVPYGAELIVYENGGQWAKVKWNKETGYIASEYVLNKQDFIRLNSIWGDSNSKEVVGLAKYRLALLNYFKANNLYGNIEAAVAKEIFGKTIPDSDIWQVLAKPKESKYNSVYLGKLVNPNSKYNDFAVLISDKDANRRKCLIFSFDDNETPYLLYEADTPSTGDISSIRSSFSSDIMDIVYQIEYR